jgi:DNA-binding NtrC family response regulator
MRRILVLEDEALIAMMLQDWLTELGCEMIGPAASVRSALDIACGSELDGAILDVSLSDGDCFSVADALRNRGVPFAFATGHGASAVAARFKNEFVLRKPFAFDAVKDTVSRLLEQSHHS